MRAVESAWHPALLHRPAWQEGEVGPSLQRRVAAWQRERFPAFRYARAASAAGGMGGEGSEEVRTPAPVAARAVGPCHEGGEGRRAGPWLRARGGPCLGHLGGEEKVPGLWPGPALPPGITVPCEPGLALPCCLSAGSALPPLPGHPGQTWLRGPGPHLVPRQHLPPGRDVQGSGRTPSGCPVGLRTRAAPGPGGAGAGGSPVGRWIPGPPSHRGAWRPSPAHPWLSQRRGKPGVGPASASQQPFPRGSRCRCPASAWPAVTG